ncbi:GNAT family N-acetyltransferase [Cryobacterium sp.]|uniref:GNAT family N-acetyltransferase n=1 Tax=Cryobacterium sp. TaxID=1926290 RepID=UPI00260BA9FF|nr:GNAT family N-acetyltransferase [Cryobacterium sp.]MCU1444998.1 acetyltransferase [Cryobacterium sp.]
MTTSQTTPNRTLVIEPMASAADTRAFRELNEEWITALFTLEAADRALLDNPADAIVGRGGQVLIARAGADRVGCVAVVPTGNGVFELSKMAVSPAERNRGTGRRLILAAIDMAAALGATTLFLGSSTRLPSAVHLYESVGFSHVPAERIGPMPYARADVFMELVLPAR